MANEGQKKNIDLPREQMMSIQAIPQALMGKKQPIVIDHYALAILFEEYNADWTRNLEEGKK